MLKLTLKIFNQEKLSCSFSCQIDVFIKHLKQSNLINNGQLSPTPRHLCYVIIHTTETQMRVYLLFASVISHNAIPVKCSQESK